MEDVECYKRNSLAIFGQISAVGVFPDDMLALAADLLDTQAGHWSVTEAGTPFMLAYGKVYVDGSVYWGPGGRRLSEIGEIMMQEEMPGGWRSCLKM